MSISDSALTPLYVEINLHTGERRTHTIKSFLARTKALGISNLRLTNTKHVEFRKYSSATDTHLLSANPDGSWGLNVLKICDDCEGKGYEEVDAVWGQMKVFCRRCRGTGKVL